MEILKRTLLCLFFLLSATTASAGEFAFFCKWDGGDIIFAVRIDENQEFLERVYDSEAGSIHLRITDLKSSKFKSEFEFRENGKTFTKTAKCTKVGED